ncbi:hypothetical protein HDF10_002887 [Edaphobacter lichenicola]|uniref:Uncharacterized protein n=1 Tax=Tunturiibacter lichenicola TaxID=2051959 RepID=A0A7W8JBB4_9BACT|nr:hypothetical protein [Edaphobacter lichenicola]
MGLSSDYPSGDFPGYRQVDCGLARVIWLVVLILRLTFPDNRGVHVRRLKFVTADGWEGGAGVVLRSAIV